MSIALHDRKEEFFFTLVMDVKLPHKSHLTHQALAHLRKHFLVFHQLIGI
ncbi:Uncharacterised protein [Streptococcus pneumoniae]|nr:Uncharacterised protein [Streptococcus pneumoniae]